MSGDRRVLAALLRERRQRASRRMVGRGGLLDRIGPPAPAEGAASTTRLGDWFATALSWRSQVALLVSETTLLPILMPLAPAATLPARFAPQLSAVLAAHSVPQGFIDAGLQQMTDLGVAKTANRSVVGIMNEFTCLAGACRHDEPDLLRLALRLARTPCGPLYKRHVSPDRELAALIAADPTTGLTPGVADHA